MFGKSLEMEKVMEEKIESITFETEDGEKISLYIIEHTVLAGTNYLLAADSQEDEAQAYIMREIMDEENQKIYEMVDDDTELEALSKIFTELLDDVVLEM